ncbi:MAG TPA: rhodanese-like domain-containing protein [Solirubrobacteraceae bacterium]|nr:rhodanese-like domain-containing protein [Solirubrobacteraceae bacterium]
MAPAVDTSALEIDPRAVFDWRAREPDLQLIDVREPHEHEAGHIEGDRHVPLVELAAAASSLAQERPVVFYCRVGSRSQMAAQAYRTAGFEAYSMSGGLLRWAGEQLPLTPEDGHVADH